MNYSIGKSILGIIIFGVVLFTSCKHQVEKDGDMIGPFYVAPTEGFKITKDTMYLSTKKPEFAIRFNPLNIRAGFNQKVSWFVKINGLTSKAYKSFAGLSDTINVDWTGVSENIYFFKKGEKCSITLSIYGDDKFTIIDTINIETVYRYGGIGGSNPLSYRSEPLGGIIYHFIDDLERYPDTLLGLTAFGADLADEDCIGCVDQRDAIDPVQGDYSYRLSGFDNNGNTFVGSMNTERIYTLGKRISSGISNDDLYVNFYLYGDGSNSSTSIIVFAYEMDKLTYFNKLKNKTGQDSVTVRENLSWPVSSSIFNTYSDQKFTLDQTINDKWQATVNVNWTGWRLISLKYSEFKKPTLNSGLGGGDMQAERLCGLAFELDDNPSSGKKVFCKIDYVTVTENGKFKQQ